MSHVTNQKAIAATRVNKKHAIFIVRSQQRYAVIELSPYIYKEYQEEGGKWVETDGVVSFLVWNGEFQGYDDISTLIEG